MASSSLLGTVGHSVISTLSTWKWEDLGREATVLSQGLCLVPGTCTLGAAMGLHLRHETRHMCELIACHYICVCAGYVPAKQPNA